MPPIPLAALEPRRIAVLRALALGDLLCAVPALRSIRAAFRDAEVTLVGLPWAAEFVGRFAHYLDALIELPGYPGLPEQEPVVAAIPEFLRDAQARRFDLVVQLHGSGDVTNPLAVLLGGRRTAGFFRADGYCPDPETFTEYPARGPEPVRLLRLPEFLGLPVDGAQLEFPLTDADREELRHLEIDGDYACVHPGSRLPSRRWAPESFAAVADAVAERGLRVVLTGSESERPITGAVAAAMREPAVDVAGRTSLGALGALLERARLLVSNDTGVSHVAAALRVPSVVVFTASDPRRWAPLDGALHRAVTAPVVRPEQVIAEVDGLLERDGS
ncbi:MAG: glycosyltransferase family 9 protein [Thermoleophilia bacterium]|nr:glycosyltransferase family 9 protein [Thermoleophilia bacterium]